MLRDFILAELQQRHMSEREFAKLVGVANTTISRAVGETPPEPTLSFLVKLADATSVDICTLVLLALDRQPTTNLSIRLTTQRIERLPPRMRAVVEVILESLALQQGDDTQHE